VRISLPLGTEDGPAVEFAADLADASAIQLVPPTPLTEIVGINDAEAKQLQNLAYVGSAEALLEAGATPKGRRTVAEKTGLSLAKVYEWVKMADLMRIDWVDGRYAYLLLKAGVDSVNELKERNTANLLTRMKTINGQLNLVDRLPGQARVAAWIEQAKKLGTVLVAG
jgi:hypothetical protein